MRSRRWERHERRRVREPRFRKRILDDQRRHPTDRLTIMVGANLQSGEHLIGQPDAVRTLQGLLKNGGLPHAIMLNGPSGTGKTTVARILRDRLKCGQFREVNCATLESPLDTVREIEKKREEELELATAVAMRLIQPPSFGNKSRRF